MFKNNIALIINYYFKIWNDMKNEYRKKYTKH